MIYKHLIEEYLALGQTKDERLNNYRELFRAHIETELLTKIRENINKGLDRSNERFTTQIENLTKRRITARKAGRPKKDNQATDNAQDNQLHTLTPMICLVGHLKEVVEPVSKYVKSQVKQLGTLCLSQWYNTQKQRAYVENPLF